MADIKTRIKNLIEQSQRQQIEHSAHAQRAAGAEQVLHHLMAYLAQDEEAESASIAEQEAVENEQSTAA